MTTAELPAMVSRARLPETYTKAREALATCARIDECKDWADKAEAMASYARQSGDTELRKMADRIQARAIDRCGQLIKQIPADKGGRPKTGSGPQPSLTDRELARIAAGISKHLAKTAVAVNSIPRARFEREVEGANPPSVTKLAEIGRSKRPKSASTAPAGADSRKATPEEARAAADVSRAVDAFLRATKGVRIDDVLNGCTRTVATALKQNAADAQAWLLMLGMKMKGRRSWAAG